MGTSLEFGSDSGSRELNKMGTGMARLNFKSSWFIYKLHSFSIQGVLIARQSQETWGRLLLWWNSCFIRIGKFIMSGDHHLLVRVTGDLCFLGAHLPHDLKDVPCAAPSSSHPPLSCPPSLIAGNHEFVPHLSFQECYIKWNHKVCDLWDWLFFTQHNAFEGHLICCINSLFLNRSKECPMVWMDVPHFV